MEKNTNENERATQFLNEPLATEIIHDYKRSNKFWRIFAFVELGVILTMILLYMIDRNIPTEEYQYEQTMEDVEESTATQMIGGTYNGENETESELQTPR